jgi:hypothetical protein
VTIKKRNSNKQYKKRNISTCKSWSSQEEKVSRSGFQEQSSFKGTSDYSPLTYLTYKFNPKELCLHYRKYEEKDEYGNLLLNIY